MELALNHKKTDLAIKVMKMPSNRIPQEPLLLQLDQRLDKAKMFEQAEQARKRLKDRFSKRAKESSAS
jgi:superkiller protein 3